MAGNIPCPWCDYAITKIEDTQYNSRSKRNRRYRRCLKCFKRFTTYEIYASTQTFNKQKVPNVTKRNAIDLSERTITTGVTVARG